MIDIKKYSDLLHKITPKYVSAVFSIPQCPVPLTGKSINKFLDGYKSVLICAATLGEEFDRLLRQIQLTDMAGAVILDSLAGEYLESFCDKKESAIFPALKGMPATVRRFSPGYGDFPLSVNRDVVTVLNASIKIGLCVTEEYILTPQKSITGVVGVI
jgi:hypothetical protein